MENLLTLMRDNGGEISKRARFNIIAGFAAGSIGRSTGYDSAPLVVPATDLIIGGLFSKESIFNYTTFGAGVGLAYVDKVSEYVTDFFK